MCDFYAKLAWKREKNKRKRIKNKKIAIKLNTKVDNIKSVKILKESIDARKKPEIYYVYEVAVELLDYFLSNQNLYQLL
mgnify:CR=1 FL=1